MDPRNNDLIQQLVYAATEQRGKEGGLGLLIKVAAIDFAVKAGDETFDDVVAAAQAIEEYLKG